MKCIAYRLYISFAFCFNIYFRRFHVFVIFGCYLVFFYWFNDIVFTGENQMVVTEITTIQHGGSKNR